MSTTILFVETMVRIPASHAGAAEDLFIHLTQCGSSNCFECGTNGRYGRCARSWQVNAFGTERDVLTACIKTAGYTADHCIVVGGLSGRTTPEAYIRRSKRFLSVAKKTNLLHGHAVRNEHISVAAYIDTPDAAGKDKRSYFDLRRSDECKAFWEGFQAKSESNRAWHFFNVSGPELH
jgi:hypothetical protein